MDTLKTAWRSLSRRRLRTWLTMGGIIIGVSLVSLVTVIGTVGKATVNHELESMGLGGLSVTASGDATLDEESLFALRSLDEVESAVPLMVESSSVSLRKGGMTSLMMCGIDSGEVQAIGLELLYGRLLSASDIGSCARVCVVDTEVAQTVYGRQNVVGKTLTVPIGGVEEILTVVGVTRADSALFQNVAKFIPSMVYMPYTSMQQLTGRSDFDQVAVRLRENEGDTARIEAVLARADGSGVYETQDLSAQKEKLSGLMNIVTWILTAISAISLLVSGLSIMTVMMVSVGERTREIGIKKALGATKGDILREFLTEALLLSVGGGVIGVAIGFAAGAVGAMLFSLDVPSVSSLLWLVLFAAAIGVAFGGYPAAKAARLDPVEALRCE